MGSWQQEMLTNMAYTGKVAFGVILALAAITGILAFYLFDFAAPEPGIMYSVSRANLPPSESTTSQNGTKGSASEEEGNR